MSWEKEGDGKTMEKEKAAAAESISPDASFYCVNRKSLPFQEGDIMLAYRDDEGEMKRMMN